MHRNQPFDPNCLSNGDRINYDKSFFQLDSNRDGLIEGNEAVTFFTPSGLKREELARVWNLSDINRRGRLTKFEFRIAMHLVKMMIRGIALPSVLPLSLLQSAKTGPQTQTPPPIPPRILKMEQCLLGKEERIPEPTIASSVNSLVHTHSPPSNDLYRSDSQDSHDSESNDEDSSEDELEEGWEECDDESYEAEEEEEWDEDWFKCEITVKSTPHHSPLRSILKGGPNWIPRDGEDAEEDEEEDIVPQIRKIVSVPGDSPVGRNSKSWTQPAASFEFPDITDNWMHKGNDLIAVEE